MTQDILQSILQDDSAFESVIKKFPKLCSPCVSIRQNISHESTSTSTSIILGIYKKNKALRVLIDKLNSSKPVGVDVTGKVLVISKEESDYNNIIQMSIKENWKYKGISIIPDYNQLRLYFY